MTTTTHPECPVCEGTGIDEAFGSPCNCEVQMRASVFQNPHFTAGITDTTYAVRTPQTGERGMQRRSTGTPGNVASPKQIAFLTSLVAERDAENPVVKRAAHALTSQMSKAAASEYIDAMMAIGRTTTTTATAAPGRVRSNRYAGRCITCGTNVAEGAGRIAQVDGKWKTFHLDGGCPVAVAPSSGIPGEDGTPPLTPAGIDLSALPSGTYGVPGFDTRLKVRVNKPTRGNWKGWTFVDDGAEYGMRRKYGRQAPGATYTGDIVPQLEAILANPAEAARLYGELTGACCICNRTLEDETSVERGVGPVCWRKYGGSFA